MKTKVAAIYGKRDVRLPGSPGHIINGLMISGSDV